MMVSLRKPALFFGPSTMEERQAQAAAPDWGSVNDFVYQLQDMDLDALGKRNSTSW